MDRTDLRYEIRDTWDSGDPWGSCMAWAFACADELCRRGEGAADLAAACYSPGAGGDGRDPDDPRAEVAAEASTPALLYWFRRLMRWRRVLRHTANVATGLEYSADDNAGYVLATGGDAEEWSRHVSMADAEAEAAIIDGPWSIWRADVFDGNGKPGPIKARW